jgi:zinc finger protein
MREPTKLDKQPCPICKNNTLTLIEEGYEIPFFGKCFLYSMDCSSCNYHMADVEATEQKEPCKYELDIENEKDMHIRVVKSSQATIKIPHIATIESGPASNGYITNVEGVFNRIKVQTEHLRDEAEEEEDRKKAKNRVKKIINIMWGKEKSKLIIEDPSGNSSIISDKARKTVLKK